MILKPNINALVQRAIGFDIHGRPKLSAPEMVKCRIVHFKKASVKSNVRADSSASRGRADETIHDTMILFDKNCNIKIDDVVVVLGEKLKVESVEVRLDTNSRIDHFEVKLQQWE